MNLTKEKLIEIFGEEPMTAVVKRHSQYDSDLGKTIQWHEKIPAWEYHLIEAMKQDEPMQYIQHYREVNDES